MSDLLGSIVEYSQGCSKHKRCSGHLCVTPQGITLMPHFVSRGEGMLKNSGPVQGLPLQVHDDQDRSGEVPVPRRHSGGQYEDCDNSMLGVQA